MGGERPLKVLVVDDSFIFKRAVAKSLKEIPGVEVAGSASDGKEAIAQTEALSPDLLVLDLEMPVMGGLEVLRALKENFPGVGAILLSSKTRKGSEETLRAMELGAFDFVPKPEAESFDQGVTAVRKALAPKIRAFQNYLESKRARNRPGGKESGSLSPSPGKKPSCGPDFTPQVLGVGSSTGGPPALGKVIPALPESFPFPVFVVQHMPGGFTRSLAEDLDKRSPLRVMEAEDGMEPRAGEVYIAPGGTQMKIGILETRRKVIRITDDPPENACKPSVDYLFRSLAEVYRGRVLAVVLTGMGRDGAKGAAALKAKGACVIAQDEETCLVYGMPKAVVEEGAADKVLPLEKISTAIAKVSGVEAVTGK